MDIKVTDQLLEIALHIREPWKITKIDFPQEGKDGERLDIYIDFIKGTIFPCPVCGGSATAYDTRMKTWRHREICQYGVRVSLVMPGIVTSGFQEVAGYNQENFGKSIAQFGKVLEPQAIADSIHWLLTLPPHVNINEIMVRPTGQSFP